MMVFVRDCEGFRIRIRTYVERFSSWPALTLHSSLHLLWSNLLGTSYLRYSVFVINWCTYNQRHRLHKQDIASQECVPTRSVC